MLAVTVLLSVSTTETVPASTFAVYTYRPFGE
jgi:hypothetical protein